LPAVPSSAERVLGVGHAQEGLVGAEVDATAIADLFDTLMPGMLVTRHLYKPATAARLAEGMVAFAVSGH
jgi:hypothetical protein